VSFEFDSDGAVCALGDFGVGRLDPGRETDQLLRSTWTPFPKKTGINGRTNGTVFLEGHTNRSLSAIFAHFAKALGQEIENRQGTRFHAILVGKVGLNEDTPDNETAQPRDLPQWLSVAEAATIWRVSAKTVYAAIRPGRLLPDVFGRIIRIPASDLRETTLVRAPTKGRTTR